MEQKIRLNTVSKFDHCYGCGVCGAVCPHNAISIKQNDYGFLEPLVNIEKCTGCSLCLKVCEFNAKEEQSFPLPLYAYAGWSVQEEIRDKSTTAGVIYELCANYISQGYSICAVRYNYELKRAEHFIFSSIDDLQFATGSKYLQSFTVDAIASLDWVKGKYVIVGTPCMISSMRRLSKLHDADERIIYVDFFCHGIPSYQLWEKYERYVSSQIGEIRFFSWRNKVNGWQDSYVAKAKGSKGRYLSFLRDGDLFYRFFLGNKCLNECCYDDCIFKHTHSCADIRVGDMWGDLPEYVDNRLGVNSILVFSEKGNVALKKCNKIFLAKEKLDAVLYGQIPKSPSRPRSFNYVRKALREDISLVDILKKSRRIERIGHYFRFAFYKVHMMRVLRKLGLTKR